MYLYHATNSENAPEILEKGLIPKGPFSAVCFSTSIAGALGGAEFTQMYKQAVRLNKIYCDPCRAAGRRPPEIYLCVTVFAVPFSDIAERKHKKVGTYWDEWRSYEPVPVADCKRIDYYYISDEDGVFERWYEPKDETDWENDSTLQPLEPSDWTSE